METQWQNLKQADNRWLSFKVCPGKILQQGESLESVYSMIVGTCKSVFQS